MPFEGSSSYRTLLLRLDEWFIAARASRPEVPCSAGCTACCHGPFDISVADVELVVDAVRRLPRDVRGEVLRRARAQAERLAADEPGWREPWHVADLGEARFDALCDAHDSEPCPLLGDDGRCRIYADRPLVCRMLGLGMRTRSGRVLDNACPIQESFPGYGALEPVSFDLEGLEAQERLALETAASRLFGTPSAWDYETIIATALVAFADDA
ncbi:MAG TPA: YkgJ family cysteine cluster protein [Gemmatimonadales bacterium]|nr:YkgJ family cysteine cluster protein [Gemmatimonadales bacterium]